MGQISYRQEKKPFKSRLFLYFCPPTGLEPVTHGLGVHCSPTELRRLDAVLVPMIHGLYWTRDVKKKSRLGDSLLTSVASGWRPCTPLIDLCLPIIQKISRSTLICGFVYHSNFYVFYNTTFENYCQRKKTIFLIVFVDSSRIT